MHMCIKICILRYFLKLDGDHRREKKEQEKRWKDKGRERKERKKEKKKDWDGPQGLVKPL